jgi:hypothetical protein
MQDLGNNCRRTPARRQPPVLFEVPDEPLDAVALAVELPFVIRRVGSAFPARYHRLDALQHEVAPDPVAVVCAIAEQGFWLTCHQRSQPINRGGLVRLARRQHHAQWQAVCVGAQVQLGAVAAARAAERVGPAPPFAPAAQRCARIVVLSMLW